MADIEKEREAFERWFSGDNKYPRAVERNGDNYRLGTAQSAWLVWQARAERAEAAQPSEQAQLLVLARIREALGDPHATLMHDELVERIRGLCAEAAQRVPDGCRLVPVEPTPEMLAATSWPGCAATDYRHMLAAAPDAPPAAQRVPLTDDQIFEYARGRYSAVTSRNGFMAGARWAERQHGITATEPKGERDA